MIIALKIILAILVFGCLFLNIFAVREYKVWLKSNEAQEASLFDRFIVNIMMWGTLISLSGIAILSTLLIFSKITITLPWF